MRSFDLDLRADSILKTVLERKALAKDGLCCFENSMEFIVAAWGQEASYTGTMIGLE